MQDVVICLSIQSRLIENRSWLKQNSASVITVAHSDNECLANTTHVTCPKIEFMALWYINKKCRYNYQVEGNKNGYNMPNIYQIDNVGDNLRNVKSNRKVYL